MDGDKVAYWFDGAGELAVCKLVCVDGVSFGFNANHATPATMPIATTASHNELFLFFGLFCSFFFNGSPGERGDYCFQNEEDLALLFVAEFCSVVQRLVDFRNDILQQVRFVVGRKPVEDRSLDLAA